MTDERTFDRLARAWLELGPDEAPDRVIAAVLQATEATPQVRRPLRWPIWRSFPMPRLPIVATVVAILVVVVGGGLFLSRSNGPAQVGGPSPSPIASPSPTASATPAASAAAAIPDALVSMWVGAPRSVAGLVPNDRYRFQLTADQLTFPNDSLSGTPQLVADASAPAAGRLEFVTGGSTDGCAHGDTGTYGWSLSPGGTILTITSQTDACATRGLAMPGQWFRVDCTNVSSGCLGNLEAGTHASQYIAPGLPDGGTWAPHWGALTYTTPAGWANSADWPDSFSLTPSVDYAKETKDGAAEGTWHQIDVFTRPAAVDSACANTVLANVPRTVDGLMAHLTSSKALTASKVHTIVIGGQAAKWVDISLAPTWTDICPEDSKPSASLFAQVDDPAGGWGIGLSDKERERIFVIDLGGGLPGLIVVDSADPTRFDQLATDAMPIIESFRFN
jgi:hypothetical protein